MTERVTAIWHPRAEDFTSSGVSQLMVRYDELLERSLRETDVYWRAVFDHCEVAWDRSPDASLDESAGPEFPRRCPGGALNRVNTVLAWGRRSEAAGRDAVVAEREDGSVEVLSYADLDRSVREFAGGLRALGIARGDRVALFKTLHDPTTIVFDVPADV